MGEGLLDYTVLTQVQICHDGASRFSELRARAGRASWQRTWIQTIETSMPFVSSGAMYLNALSIAPIMTLMTGVGASNYCCPTIRRMEILVK